MLPDTFVHGFPERYSPLLSKLQCQDGNKKSLNWQHLHLHTSAGIISIYFTCTNTLYDPQMILPKQTQRQDFKAFCLLNKPHQEQDEVLRCSDWTLRRACLKMSMLSDECTLRWECYQMTTLSVEHKHSQMSTLSDERTLRWVHSPMGTLTDECTLRWEPSQMSTLSD